MVSNHRWGSNEGGAFTAAVGTKPHKKSIQDGVIARGDVSNTSPLMSQGGKAGIRSDGDARTWDVRNPNIERLSDSIIQYSVSCLEDGKSDCVYRVIVYMGVSERES